MKKIKAGTEQSSCRIASLKRTASAANRKQSSLTCVSMSRLSSGVGRNRRMTMRSRTTMRVPTQRGFRCQALGERSQSSRVADNIQRQLNNLAQRTKRCNRALSAWNINTHCVHRNTPAWNLQWTTPSLPITDSLCLLT